MPREKMASESETMLVNKLSVADARHILRCEGSDFSLPSFLFQVASIIGVAVTTARAIVIGNATIWHLALPMVAEYVAIIVALPFVYFFMPHPELRQHVVSTLRLWIGYLILAAVALFIQAHQAGVPPRQQLAIDASWLYHWIVDAHMQWPILLAFISELAAIPGRVRNLYEFGPPYVGVSLGCAMRFLVLIVGWFLLPWLVSGSIPVVWFLWAMITISEAGALWMRWDLQKRLKKYDALTRS
jgi:hypothetical protein